MSRSSFVFLGLAGALLFRTAQASAQAQIATDGTNETAPTVATGPTTPPAPDGRDWMALIVHLGGGIAIVPGDRVGGYGRFGAEGLVTKDPKRSGFIWGFWDAFEGWAANEAGGFALPLLMYVGYRAPPFITNISGGLNLFTIDTIDSDGGFGILSPRGEARIGLHAGSFLLVAVGGIQRRWQWGREDITLIQAGVTVGWGEFFREQPRVRSGVAAIRKHL